MLVTEKEAKEKICVFQPHDREPSGDVNLRSCQGSKCMQWRFDFHDQNYGYCGLAGLPTGTSIRFKTE